MKRATFALMVCFGAASWPAAADNSIYYSVGRTRSDADLQAATDYCDSKFGAVHDGEQTPSQYKRCMLGRGWRYGHTERDASSGYPDPDGDGDTCHDFWILGIKGAACGNF